MFSLFGATGGPRSKTRVTCDSFALKQLIMNVALFAALTFSSNGMVTDKKMVGSNDLLQGKTVPSTPSILSKVQGFNYQVRAVAMDGFLLITDAAGKQVVDRSVEQATRTSSSHSNQELLEC